MNIKKKQARIINFFTVVLRDPNRKNVFRIAFEYLKFLLSDRAIADQYFHKYMYRKGMYNFKDYLVSEKVLRKSWTLNNPDYIPILDNKYLFDLFFTQHGLSVVKSFAHNNHSLFFIENKLRQINSLDEFQNFLKELLRKSSTGNGIFIKRTEASLGGKGIFKLSQENMDSQIGNTETLFNEILKSNYLFQEVVVQHEEINKLNPSCLNTIRFDTFTNRQSESKVLSSFIRLGVNKAIVDNVSSGGVYVGVNIADGKLYAEAHSDFTHGRAKTYTIHPQTNCKFIGYQLPFFTEAKQLAIEAAQHLKQVRLIGWDIAITPEGPVLIEGNDTPGLIFSEISQKGFNRNPVFMEMFNEISK